MQFSFWGVNGYDNILILARPWLKMINGTNYQQRKLDILTIFILVTASDIISKALTFLQYGMYPGYGLINPVEI